MRIYFIKLLRLKFVEFLEYFENKLETEILKEYKFVGWKFVNTNNDMFFTKLYKIFPFSKREN